MGVGALAVGLDAVAVGPRSLAVGDNAVAVGNGATALGNNALALGAYANAVANNSVALGANSVADRANTVSVGSTGAERQITNVAAGSAPTDAVNMSQLQGLGANVLSQANAYSEQLAKKAYGGVAAVMAMGDAPYAPGKLSVYEGLGYYRGEVAVGVSLRRTSDNGRWSIVGGASYSRTGGVGAKIGATQIFDLGD
ncbi:MAG: YadA family autotransporter adhesin [Formosimonas sp.]